MLVRPSYHLTFDLALQRNDIDLPLPMHDFVTNLVTSRIGYAFNTRTFLDTLLQYNTDLKQFSANVRFDLIHRPLSDLFLVYNEQRLTEPADAGQHRPRADPEVHAHARVLMVIGQLVIW